MKLEQVERSHYLFGRYLKKARWASIWHQVDEVLSARPASVLEIGPGPGILKAMLLRFGIPLVETLDIDADLNPDHLSSGDTLPFWDGQYDVVCSFQMLEHVPYEIALRMFSEMARVATNKVIISLPDAHRRGAISLHLSKTGSVWLPVFMPLLWRFRHRFDGQHHWEINKKGYALSRVQRDFEICSGLVLDRTYRVRENLYHRFFVWRVKSESG